MLFELAEVATCQAILPLMNGWLKVCVIDRKSGASTWCPYHLIHMISDIYQTCPFSVVVRWKLKSEVAGT